MAVDENNNDGEMVESSSRKEVTTNGVETQDVGMGFVSENGLLSFSSYLAKYTSIN